MVDRKKIREIVRILSEKNKTIATMESCTGGGLVNEITNIEGASDVLKYSAVTYSNDYKIKMGVNPQIIKQYSVYSIETAMEMSKVISNYAKSNYGIGITGKLNRIDKNNLYGKNNQVFISIYDSDNNKYYNFNLFVNKNKRNESKNFIINFVTSNLLKII